MKLKLYQIDAFTDRVFSGNPAAVCPLEAWLSDEAMQNIAMENNLSETAFFVREGDSYTIRWFTPAAEVDLCGHATLASAYVLFNCENHGGSDIRFRTLRSGELAVRKDGGCLVLNFPADVIRKTEITRELADGFNTRPVEAYRGKSDYMLVFSDERQVEGLEPDFRLLSQVNTRGIIVTARGSRADFVSRFFAPGIGVDEDPVTGSAHTTLIPYWAEKLGKTELTAVQVSKRGGRLMCRLLGDRVEIGGMAKMYLAGEIFIE